MQILLVSQARAGDARTTWLDSYHGARMLTVL
jgi:hypothetical protein